MGGRRASQASNAARAEALVEAKADPVQLLRVERGGEALQADGPGRRSLAPALRGAGAVVALLGALPRLAVLVLQPERTRFDPSARPRDGVSQRDSRVRVVAEALGHDRRPQRQHRGTVDADLACLAHALTLIERAPTSAATAPVPRLKSGMDERCWFSDSHAPDMRSDR